MSIKWPCVFTLNYDTLIEDFNNAYYTITPFDKINKYHIHNKTRLYKIHGDVKRYLATGDTKYLILSKEQYIKSMMSDQNRDMLDGRPRGYMRRFGLSRINFREKASKGEIPGVTKSSW